MRIDRRLITPSQARETRIARGEHHMPPVSVTIPEGFNVNQIADVFSLKLANFNKTNFLQIFKIPVASGSFN